MILFVSVATSGEVQIAQRSPTFPWRLPTTAPDESGPQITVFAPIGVHVEGGRSTRWEFHVPDFVSVVLQISVVAFGIAVLVASWRRRPRLRWRRSRPFDDFAALDDIAAMMSAEAGAQREVLLVGEPRNAIVACWLSLEALIANAGLKPNPADTSAEFTAQVLSQFAVDPLPVGGLASLYREARFSSHVMGEDQRAAAVHMLDAFHDGLRSDDGAVLS
jgi:hypothetical protein